MKLHTKIIATLLWALFLALQPDAAAKPPTPEPWMPCSGINKIDQKFPVSGPEETRWLLCWDTVPRQGLVIHWAFFRTSPSAKWVQIFWDARVSDIFVPYHDSAAYRYYDMSEFSFPLEPIGAKDCPASVGGTPLGGIVCKQVHDRGIAWKHDANVQRGEELTLWSTLGADNYNYIMEWTFRDDGVVMGRVGATATNLPGVEMMTHVHNPIWRLDIDLDGFTGDSVNFGTHTEGVPSALLATDTEPLIASEKGLDWDPHAFNQLNVYDANLKNALGHQSSMQLIALPTGGLSRNDEEFTHHDFWVTRYKPTEMWAANLPAYSSPPENVSNADVVVWYKGSVHHHPRDEDGEYGPDGWVGDALIMWTGWMLKPHNLFDHNPLHPKPQSAPANSVILVPDIAFPGGLLTGVVIGPDDEPVPNTPVELASGGVPATLSGEVIGEPEPCRSGQAANDPNCPPEKSRQITPGPPVDCAALLKQANLPAQTAGMPPAGVPATNAYEQPAGSNALTGTGGGPHMVTDAAGRFAMCMTPGAPQVDVNLPGAGKVTTRATEGRPNVPNEPPDFLQPNQKVSLIGLLRDPKATQNGRTWLLPAVQAWSPDGRQTITAFKMPKALALGPVQLSYTGSDGQPHQTQSTVFRIMRAFLDRSQLHSSQGATFEYDVQFAGQAQQNLCVEMHIAGPIVLVEPPAKVIPMDANGLGRFRGKIRATKVTPGAVVPFDLLPDIHVCDKEGN